jgi:raffinose/stachyose/melibiose transport system permease protein
MKIQKRWIALFTIPSIILFLLVFGVSIVVLVGSSFTDWSIGSKMNFVGFENYIDLFKNDSAFTQSVINTLIWILLQSTIHVAIGVVFALILSRKKFYWKFARTIYMIPNIISAAALGMMFKIMFNPEFGAVNTLIHAMGNKDFNLNWFMNKSSAFFTVTITWLPFAATVSILVLAEIAAIDKSIYEAAEVDGATEFQTMRFVTLPMLRNIIGTTAILAATSMLQKLDILMMTTKGGPLNTTLNMPMYIYNTALIDNNFARAKTAGVYLILMGLVTVLILSKLFKVGQTDLQ